MRKLALSLVPALLLVGLLLLSFQLGSAECEGCEIDPTAAPRAESMSVDAGETAGDAGPALVGRKHENVAPRERHDVRVQLLDRRDRPVPGVQIFVSRGRESAPGLQRGRLDELRTDERGEIVVPKVILDGKTLVHAVEDGPLLRTIMRDWARPVALTRTHHVIRSELGLELRVSVVDAETGRVVPGARWGNALTGDRKSGARRPIGTIVRMKAGQEDYVPFHISAPAGYVAWDRTREYAFVEAGTELVTAVYPLRREASVELRLVGGDSNVDFDDVSISFHIGYRSQVVDVRPDAQGRVALRGVPFFRDQPITVRVRAGALVAFGHARLPARPQESTAIVIDLDELAEPVEEDLGEIGIGGGAGGLRPPVSEVARGTLRIRGFLPNGRPAAGRPVRARRTDDDRIAGPTWLEGVTDAEGRVSWTGVPAGSWTVELEGPRFKTWRDLRITGGSTTEASLWEPQGGRVRVRVVDARGNPLPFARFHVSPQDANTSWVEPAVNGTQRLDDYVDERGERVLDRVAPGMNEISATYGSRDGRAELEVADGGGATIVIRVADEDLP